MMQLPDCTLFLQMIHFIIAYIILRHYVFLPSLYILQSQAAKKEALDFNVLHLKSEKQKLSLLIKNQWQLIKQTLLATMPTAQKTCLIKHPTSFSIEQKELSEKEKDAIKNMVKRNIVDQI